VALRAGLRVPARKAVRALPDTLYISLRFVLATRRIPHLRNPRTLSEVMLWLKLHGALERYAPYVDKYEVRQYVARTIGSQYLNPLIGVWDEFDQIPWDDLPQQFVLKSTHGSGGNFVCRDKSAADVASVRQAVTKWMSENYYHEHREPQYRDIRPRLIAEAYLEDDSGDLRDYKFSCFEGVPFLLEVFSNRGPGMTVNLYDPPWRLLPVVPKGWSNSQKPITRPALLNDLLDAVAKLSAAFPLVRVDMYYVDDKIYFGELTFTPNNGFITYDPKSFNRELRRRLDLSKLNAVGPQQASRPARAKLSLSQIKSLARARRG
jgi:TupA-like ATPgrasp